MRMHPQKIRPKITRFESCDSTNRLLLDAAEAGVSAGTVFVARQQLAGRGRRGRSWQAAADHSLTFSLLWIFPPDPARLQGLSLLVGLAVVQALADPRLGQRVAGARCGLKWPNDLLLHRADSAYAKAGGILIESTLRTMPEQGRELAVVIGIGLNCIADARLDAAVSDQTIGALSELFVDPVTPEALLPCVLDVLFERLPAFACEGFAPFAADWNAQDVWQHLPIQMTEDGIVSVTGICQGVGADGALRVKTDQGTEYMMTGDVSLRRI
jgi:BirA family biotin operon repressor/biotin-[acetyl-CoA-carboxylase] ligase